jgi:antitoxin MazE
VPEEAIIRAIGDAAGTTIPTALLDRYQLSEGDRVHLVQTPDGILITPYNPTFATVLEVYEKGARRYRRNLAD